MADFTKYNNQSTFERLEWFTSDMPLVKLRDLVGQRLTIMHYGFVQTRNGRKAVLQFAEYPASACFANEIITETFDQIEADGMHAACCDGSTHISIIQGTSKAGNIYYNLLFVE